MSEFGRPSIENGGPKESRLKKEGVQMTADALYLAFDGMNRATRLQLAEILSKLEPSLAEDFLRKMKTAPTMATAREILHYVKQSPEAISVVRNAASKLPTPTTIVPPQGGQHLTPAPMLDEHDHGFASDTHDLNDPRRLDRYR